MNRKQDLLMIMHLTQRIFKPKQKMYIGKKVRLQHQSIEEQWEDVYGNKTES